MSGHITHTHGIKYMCTYTLLSVQAKQSVATMEQLCQRVQQTHFLRGSGGLRGPAPKT